MVRILSSGLHLSSLFNWFGSSPLLPDGIITRKYSEMASFSEMPLLISLKNPYNIENLHELKKPEHRRFAIFLHSLRHMEATSGNIDHPLFCLTSIVPNIFKTENDQNKQWWRLYRLYESIGLNELHWTQIDVKFIPSEGQADLFGELQRYTKGNEFGELDKIMVKNDMEFSTKIQSYLLGATDRLKIIIDQISSGIDKFRKPNYKVESEHTDRRVLLIMRYLNDLDIPSWKHHGISLLISVIPDFLPQSSSAYNNDPNNNEDSSLQLLSKLSSAFQLSGFSNMTWYQFDDAVLLQYDKELTLFSHHLKIFFNQNQSCLDAPPTYRGNPITYWSDHMPNFLHSAAKDHNTANAIIQLTQALSTKQQQQQQR